jgi:hypothetical protein
LKIKSEPLLIVGTQRSGSNLLRLMLNQLPEIEAPHPPHLLTVFTPLLSSYGDLSNVANFKSLVEDVVAYISVNPVPWFGVSLNANEVMDRALGNTLAEVFRVVYEIKAETKNARYWCCKSMSNIYYLDQIDAAGIQPFYIHLLRDGRDVAASFKNAIVGEKHIYFIAQQWQKDQEICAALQAKTDPARFALIRYEEFIVNPRKALEPVLDMLGIKWTNDILNFWKSDEAKRTAAAGDMWGNVVKPVDSSNMRHYSEKLSDEEITIFEQVAGDMLDFYGYNRDASAACKNITEADLLTFKNENDLQKKEARKKYALDAKVREGQEDIVRQIKARLSQIL